MNEEIAADLQRLFDEDQRLRSDAAAEEWRDEEHTARLKEIVAAHGWPGRSLVGEDGATHAWLLAQHADHDVAWQRRCLELLAVAVEAREAEPWQLAYLTDRVRVNEGRPQLYGTQCRPRDGTPTLLPIEDEEHVDDRRAAAGMGPLAEYLEQMQARA